MYRMRRTHIIEDIIKQIDFEEIKDLDLFKMSFDALLDGDIGKNLGSDVDMIRQQFKWSFACYEMKKLIRLHMVSEDERCAQVRHEAAMKAAATRKAKAARAAKVKAKPAATTSS